MLSHNVIKENRNVTKKDKKQSKEALQIHKPLCKHKNHCMERSRNYPCRAYKRKDGTRTSRRTYSKNEVMSHETGSSPKISN